jgi:hypothetical protein
MRHVWERRTGACMPLVVNPEGKILFIRTRCRWKYNSRENLKEIFGNVWTG